MVECDLSAVALGYVLNGYRHNGDKPNTELKWS
jgi:hypothetical protein